MGLLMRRHFGDLVEEVKRELRTVSPKLASERIRRESANLSSDLGADEGIRMSIASCDDSPTAASTRSASTPYPRGSGGVRRPTEATTSIQASRMDGATMAQGFAPGDVLRLAIRLRPGNSGGALVNPHGGVVGIAHMVTGSALGLAVSSRSVRRFLNGATGEPEADDLRWS